MALLALIKRLQDIMRNDAGVGGDEQRLSQIIWILFLKVFDDKEKEWEFIKEDYTPVIPEGYRWRDWATSTSVKDQMTGEELIDFNDGSDRHAFNDVYETLLKGLQKNNGEFFTPRAITTFVTDKVNPKIGEKVADFACGTGGFLVDALEHMKKQNPTIEQLDIMQKSFHGVEKKQLPYMLCVTNMMLHDIEEPDILHGNSLEQDVRKYTYDEKFDVILMNPPYGGSELEIIQKNFPAELRNSETADLFVIEMMYRLNKNGRCGVVLPDGIMFGSDNSKTAIKKKLVEEFNLHTVIRLPESCFAPYTSITTNLLFFDNTGATTETWFYRFDLPEGKKFSMKKNPIKRKDFSVIDEWWDNRVEIKDEKENNSMTETWKARKVPVSEIVNSGYSLDFCGFPNEEKVILSPEEIISIYISKKKILEKELSTAIFNLKKKLENNTHAELKNIKSVSDKIVALDSSFPCDLKNALLQAAIQGKLTEQLDSDSSVDEMLNAIKEEKKQLIKDKKIKKEKALLPIEEEEIPFEIPDNWRWTRLRKVCTKIVDGDHNPPHGALEKTEYLMLSAQNINFNKLVDLNQVRYLTKQVFELENQRTQVQIGDIFFTIVGTLGRSCIYKGGYNISFQRSVAIISTKIFNCYLKYVLDSPFIQQYMLSRATGTAQKGFYLNQVENLLIPIPPMEEQQRIVERLKQLLPLCETL